MLRFLFGIILILGALVGAYLLEGGNLMSLLGFSAFLIVFFVPVFAALAVWVPRVLAQAWRAAFRRGPVTDRAKSAQVWKFLETVSYLSGVLATLLGGVLIMGNWFETTATNHLTHAFGALLVGPLYSTLQALFCRILWARTMQD